MSIGFVGFLAFCFVGMTLINRIMEGAFISASDISILNNLSVFRSQVLFGQFSIPVPNLNFIIVGIPHLVKWDYSFFGGNSGIIQYFLYSATAAMSFGLFLLFISTLFYTLRR
jgi:hypothetical protein